MISDCETHSFNGHFCPLELVVGSGRSPGRVEWPDLAVVQPVGPMS
jgi:hypothetical protein